MAFFVIAGPSRRSPAFRASRRRNFTFCFLDNEEIGPIALAKIAKDTGLRPEDL
jgi:hypothetical protein